MKLALGLICIFVAYGATQIAAQSVPTALTHQEAQVVDSIDSVFHAAEADDARTFHSFTTPGFYMYDDGKRWDVDSMMATIKQMHAAGAEIRWKVDAPEVHIHGQSAWVSYLNRGTITDKSGVNERQWLESAFLVENHGRWLLEFLHSSPVALAK